jgi:hypothetical protein
LVGLEFTLVSVPVQAPPSHDPVVKRVSELLLPFEEETVYSCEPPPGAASLGADVMVSESPRSE